MNVSSGRLPDEVAGAYGWSAELADDEILARLFALNQARARAGRVESRDARPLLVEPVGSPPHGGSSPPPRREG